MSQQSKRFAGGTVARRTGIEGPRHDPYSFVEYRVAGTLAGRKVDATYHTGLGEWTATFGDRIAGPLAAREYFEAEIGVSVAALDRALDRIARCCDKPRVRAESGYPGETLYVCANCGAVVYGSFNLAAVE